MHPTTALIECPPFPASADDRETFAARGAEGPDATVVRESGREPDDPPDTACWRHRTRDECLVHAKRIAVDRETRRETSALIELCAWMHARKRIGGVPHAEFLRRFDPAARWRDGAMPATALARAAAIHHLPLEELEETPAEMFSRAAFFRRLCPGEREWMAAERRARFSYYSVERRDGREIVLRDFFGEMSGRRVVRVAADELGSRRVEEGSALFARIVEFRGTNRLTPEQWDSTERAGVLDPALPARTVRRLGRPLRSRKGMVNALFEAWQRVAGSLPAGGTDAEKRGDER